MFYTECISGSGALGTTYSGLSCPNLDAYDVASSLLHMQFTQAATNGFNGISVKYNEPLDATVCRIWSLASANLAIASRHQVDVHAWLDAYISHTHSAAHGIVMEGDALIQAKFSRIRSPTM
eukprot:3933261-Ditylum_brightwellii.AAC.1